MNKPPGFPQDKPSHLSAQDRVRKQNQSQLRAIQPKLAMFSQRPKLPVAPPVYRPQPVPRVLQTKTSNNKQLPANKPGHKPLTPQVYKPNPVPRVLQTKVAREQHHRHSSQPVKQPLAQGAGRTQAASMVMQRNIATGQQPSRSPGYVKANAQVSQLKPVPATVQRSGVSSIRQPGVVAHAPVSSFVIQRASLKKLAKHLGASGTKLVVHQGTGDWYLRIDDKHLNHPGWHISIFPTKQENLPERRRNKNHSVTSKTFDMLAINDQMNYREFHVTSPTGKHYFYDEYGSPLQYSSDGSQSIGWANPDWGTAHQIANLITGTSIEQMQETIEGHKQSEWQHRENQKKEQEEWEETLRKSRQQLMKTEKQPQSMNVEMTPKLQEQPLQELKPIPQSFVFKPFSIEKPKQSTGLTSSTTSVKTPFSFSAFGSQKTTQLGGPTALSTPTAPISSHSAFGQTNTSPVTSTTNTNSVVSLHNLQKNDRVRITGGVSTGEMGTVVSIYPSLTEVVVQLDHKTYETITLCFYCQKL